ncbi:MAG TPA: Gfo/Idh/MocA family oxidoreductase, partial [Acidobacteriota bacterium]
FLIQTPSTKQSVRPSTHLSKRVIGKSEYNMANQSIGDPSLRKISVGILGCANIAAKYAIAAFKSLPDVELVAIASREKGKAQAWAEKYGLEAESYESLIARQDIDVIYSPLPVGLQEE